MRILVYGAGVLGCNLARDFFKAGKDVTLLARGKWAETIKTNGLCIKNYVLPVKSTVRVPVVTELASEDEYDVIFVAARYTQVATILDALRANKSKNVVFLGNNVQPEKLVTALPEKNVMFAFASRCVAIYSIHPRNIFLNNSIHIVECLFQSCFAL